MGSLLILHKVYYMNLAFLTKAMTFPAGPMVRG